MTEPDPIAALTASRAAGHPTSSAADLNAARNLQATLDDAKARLRILNARAELCAHPWDGIEEWVGEDGALGLKDPKVVESDVQAQIVGSYCPITTMACSPLKHYSRSSGSSNFSTWSKMRKTNMSRPLSAMTPRW